MAITTSRRRLITAIADDDVQYEVDADGHVADYPAGDDLDADDYWSFTSALWEEQDGPLEPMFQSWIQNLLFLSNLQWWERDRTSGRWQHRTGPSWRRWPVTNLTLPYFRNVLAKATKQRPAWTAIPSSLESDDLAAARLAENVLEAKWVELRMARTIRRFVGWTVLTGNGYLYPYWNEETGDMEPLMTRVKVEAYDADTHELQGITEIECPCDEQGNPYMTEEGLYDVEHEVLYRDKGEVALRALNPFQVRVDPGATDDDEVGWFIVAESIPIRDLERAFPEFRGEFMASDTSDLDRYDVLISGAGLGPDTQVVTGQIDPSEEIPKALVLHYHERPCDKYGEGRYWCVSPGLLLQEPGPLPEGGMWPCLVHLKDLDIPGRYYGGTTLESVVGLNREYNEVNQQILEHHQLLLRGKWLVPIGSQIRRGSITQEPGEVIQHTPGLAPKQAELRPLPAAVYSERERIRNDFELVTGIHRISLGDAPQGVTSGRAFLVLQEADDTDIGPFIHALELAVSEACWMLLQMMQFRYDGERLLRLAGSDRSYQIRAFQGADLEGVADIVPQTGSAFPWSQAARQSALIDLVTALPDLFIDPETGQLDRAKVQRNLIIGGLESGFADADVDYNEVQREHSRFEMFVPDPAAPSPEEAMAGLPTPQEWQNHAFHLVQHARLLKSAEVDSWHPAAKQALLLHFVDTQNKIGELVMQQQAAAAMQAGAPGGNGAAAPAPQGSPVDAEQTAIEAEEAAVDEMAESITGNREPGT